MDPTGYRAFRDWMSELGKTLHPIGPVLPDSGHKDAAIEGERKQSTSGDAVVAFMNEILQTHPEKSMLYVS